MIHRKLLWRSPVDFYVPYKLADQLNNMSDRILIRIRFRSVHLFPIQDNEAVFYVVMDNISYRRLLPLRVMMSELPAGNILLALQGMAVCGSGCSFAEVQSGNNLRVPFAGAAGRAVSSRCVISLGHPFELHCHSDPDNDHYG